MGYIGDTDENKKNKLFLYMNTEYYAEEKIIIIRKARQVNQFVQLVHVILKKKINYVINGIIMY